MTNQAETTPSFSNRRDIPLDGTSRFCHASRHDIASSHRFRLDFGPCGPVPTEKRLGSISQQQRWGV